MVVSNISAATLTVLPDGRLMLGAEELSRSESDRLRAHLAYGDGSLPAHIGLRELPDGGRELWRIEDGDAAAMTWMPAPDDALSDAERRRVDQLIEREIVPDPDDPRPEQARLRERRVHVWAIVGSLAADGSNGAAVADAYDVTPEAVLAARWYYLRHRDRFDALLRTHELG